VFRKKMQVRANPRSPGRVSADIAELVSVYLVDFIHKNSSLLIRWSKVRILQGPPVFMGRSARAAADLLRAWRDFRTIRRTIRRHGSRRTGATLVERLTGVIANFFGAARQP
jgi:hypothetical protein